MGLVLIIQRRFHFPQGGGRNAPEWVAGMDRNARPESIGISGRNASEYAITPWGTLNVCDVAGLIKRKL